MKSFQDFWDSIDWDKLNDEALQVFEPDEVHTPATIESIMKLSVTMNSALLRQYHDWLHSDKDA